MLGGLDLAQACDVHSQGRFYQTARPSGPEQRPPSHMTKPTLSGTFRGSPGQPGTFQPACLQGRGQAHRLAVVPGPQLEAHAATACPHHGPGGSRNQPPRVEGGGYSACPQGGLWVPAEGSTAPRAPHGLLHPPNPQSLLGLSTLPGETPNPRPTLWTAPGSNGCDSRRAEPPTRTSAAQGPLGLPPRKASERAWGAQRCFASRPQVPTGKEVPLLAYPTRGSSLDMAKLLLWKHSLQPEDQKSGWSRERGKFGTQAGSRKGEGC